MAGVAVPGSGPIASVEFEVFGQVQGCYFTKYLKEQCEELSVSGWVKNTKKGTLYGIIQGAKANVEMMVIWLSNKGSPGSKIDRCELKNWANLAKPEFKGFSIRF
ncbi:PREDICTED: acylphosphatase-2 [Nicrophorus vespilloides]|uniref:Acylphosphatase-2 n=1 Tax=Nicrophorus vespilloides TaxID=110193 RepID=A0ABM1N4M0_NICVS|nr:PREDICTED: acylphosphatase-2 [Nicrophorus vespilloides]